MSVRLSILAAVAKNGVIGKNNALPWHLPADLKHFKSLTMGHMIVMGRKTYDSIGRPLPGRTNIVITSQSSFQPAGVTVVHSLEEALGMKKSSDMPKDDGERFIIGGAALYQQAIAHSHRMYLTEIQHAFDGDTYFPEYNKDQWHEISREQHFTNQSENETPIEYHFVILERKTNECY